MYYFSEDYQSPSRRGSTANIQPPRQMVLMFSIGYVSLFSWNYNIIFNSFSNSIAFFHVEFFTSFSGKSESLNSANQYICRDQKHILVISLFKYITSQLWDYIVVDVMAEAQSHHDHPTALTLSHPCSSNTCYFLKWMESINGIFIAMIEPSI